MNKGFTFMELLIVIALLAVIAVIISTNMVGLQGKQTEKEYKNYVDKLETAACTYFEKNEYATGKQECRNNPSSNYCKITIDTLISKGLIAEDLYNPKEGKDVIEFKDDYVLISYIDGEKTCELQEN